ncbi:hypothetical protein [Actinacidiphila rubida]|nr:hypothetical protein [Actinacidiphila rubida]
MSTWVGLLMVSTVRRRNKTIISLVLTAAAVYGVFRFQASENKGFISIRDYNAAKIGTSEKALRSHLDPSLSSDNIPNYLPDPPGDECFYYEDDQTSIDGTTFRFCFKAGVLDLKDGYGPAFDSGQIQAAHS